MDELFCVTLCILLTSGSLGKPLLPTSKLTLATWGSYHQQDHKGPGTYAFGYDIEDPVTGNIQFKQEERHPNGTVTGNYGYVDSEGKPHVVTYISDENGYRAKIEKEGEPTQYFPSADQFFYSAKEEATYDDKEEFFINKQHSSEYFTNQIDVSNFNNFPAQRNFVYSPSNLYRLTFPSYFQYVRLNKMSS